MIKRTAPVCMVVVGVAAFSAAGYVGVSDPCLWPTPCPPPGAPWASVNNPGFEAGFAGGVANQWIGWKDKGLAGTVHAAGNDRPYSGSYSQKLMMPDPSGESQEAGIYQRIYVVPGGTYTATVRVYLQIDNPDGWDLLAFLGLDPYGWDSGDSGSTAWTEVSHYGEWRTATVTVQAVLPVMTISLKATRKFPRHRDTKVWFDVVTFTGPVPTDPPPTSDPDPVDPESLIPATEGPNLVTNPSFESAHSGDGVSSGWNKWGGGGSGQWKRSQRVGKVGGGQYGCDGEQENVDMWPKTSMLIAGNPEKDPNDNAALGVSDHYKTFDHMQDTIVIGRPMVDDNYGEYWANPTYYGTRLAEHCKNYEQRFPRIDAWLDWNEPDTSGHWQSVLEFSRAFTQRAHELGLKTVVLNMATGNPGNIWQMVNESYDPHCGELLAIADYLGHHVYGWAPDELMVTNQVEVNACDFALRPRRFKDMYDRRGWRFPPVIATEGSTSCGWHGKYTPDQIHTDLVVMGDYMNVDNWWCGYTNFVVGGQCDAWPEFDIIDQYLVDGRSMAEAIGDWNYEHPADAKDGYYSQMFGAGEVHPKNLSELTPAGLFNGGVNQAVSGLVNGESYLLVAWVKYEFRGLQPTQLKFYLGVDPTGQTSNGNAATIDWGIDQVADKAKVHETFTHVWRTFTATGPTASIWLRANHPTSNPSFKFYVDLVEVRQLDDAPPGPSIELIPWQLNHTIGCGEQLSDDVFMIRNGGAAGTITYSLQPNCSWVSVAPDNGTSSGEQDPITISYDEAGLDPGLNKCTVTVTAPEASNSGTSLLINVTVEPPAADFDKDCDVDQKDFGHLQSCMTGGGAPQTLEACMNARLDEDEDVDEADFAVFQGCFSGTGVPPPGTCP